MCEERVRIDDLIEGEHPGDPGMDLSIPINEFWRNSIKVMSSYANSPYDLEVAMELIRGGRVDVVPGSRCERT